MIKVIMLGIMLTVPSTDDYNTQTVQETTLRLVPSDCSTTACKALLERVKKLKAECEEERFGILVRDDVKRECLCLKGEVVETDHGR